MNENKKLDHFFRAKLGRVQAVPGEEVWEKLQGRLQGRLQGQPFENKKTGSQPFWVKMAASVLLVMISSWFMMKNMDTRKDFRIYSDKLNTADAPYPVVSKLSQLKIDHIPNHSKRSLMLKKHFESNTAQIKIDQVQPIAKNSHLPHKTMENLEASDEWQVINKVDLGGLVASIKEKNDEIIINALDQVAQSGTRKGVRVTYIAGRRSSKEETPRKLTLAKVIKSGRRLTEVGLVTNVRAAKDGLFNVKFNSPKRGKEKG